MMPDEKLEASWAGTPGHDNTFGATLFPRSPQVPLGTYFPGEVPHSQTCPAGSRLVEAGDKAVISECSLPCVPEHPQLCPSFSKSRPTSALECSELKIAFLLPKSSCSFGTAQLDFLTPSYVAMVGDLPFGTVTVVSSGSVPSTSPLFFGPDIHFTVAISG